MTPRLSLVIVLGLAVLALAPSAQAQQPSVRAESGGVAIGGRVSGSTFNITGVPSEQLEALVATRTKELTERTAEQKKLIALLEDKLSSNGQQIHAALDILGERYVPPERLAAKLIEVAQNFKALQEQIAKVLPGDDAKVAALKADAQKAIHSGDLTRADTLLANIEALQRAAFDRLAANMAETIAQRGDIALIKLQYREAAKRFAEAAATLPAESTYQDKRIGYLLKEADALYRQGDEFGDNGTLLVAIERQRSVLNLMPRERKPLDWATTQNNLGNALSTLGERESGTARLEEAVAAYRDALTEYTRERKPRDWATTQNNLGNALSTLGARESGTARLEEAVAAYRDALTEYTRERVPLQWATTQNNLGNALSTLGERESGTARLNEAVAAYREALKEFTSERAPYYRDVAQKNLDAALKLLDERTRQIRREPRNGG